MNGNWFDDVTATEDGFRSYQQEKTILDATELICGIMEEHGVSRTELAHRIGKSKAYVSQLLDGKTNMTLRTLADILVALGRGVLISDISLQRGGNGFRQSCDFLQWGGEPFTPWTFSPTAAVDDDRNSCRMTADLAG